MSSFLRRWPLIIPLSRRSVKCQEHPIYLDLSQNHSNYVTISLSLGPHSHYLIILSDLDSLYSYHLSRPITVYDQLQELAAAEQKDPIEIITALIDIAHQRQSWLRELEELRDLIREQGGLRIGTTKEEVIEKLRQTRREIFEAEYAHLYR